MKTKNIVVALAVFVGSVAGLSASHADVVVGPGVLNFGSVNINGGPSLQQYILIQNQDANITASGLEVSTGTCPPEAFMFNTNCPVNLAPLESCDIFVSFQPTIAMTYECSVFIAFDSEQGQAAVNLIGDGIQNFLKN